MKRLLIGLLSVLLLPCLMQPLTGQERKVENTSARTPPEMEAPARDLFLGVDDRLVLTAFRDFDYLSQERSDSLVAASQLMTDVTFTDDSEALRRTVTDARLAVFCLQLGLEGTRGSDSFAGMLARLLLQQALQFGYQYARERVRAGSLTEMDYLALPQGPGVTRTFDEVGFEARLRGEMQSSRVWREYRESRKNLPPGEK